MMSIFISGQKRLLAYVAYDAVRYFRAMKYADWLAHSARPAKRARGETARDATASPDVEGYRRMGPGRRRTGYVDGRAHRRAHATPDDAVVGRVNMRAMMNNE